MTMLPPSQGSGGSTDIVTALQGITRQLAAWVKAFQGRITQGSFTWQAANTLTVNQAAVQANSNISLTPTNAAAATLVGSSKSPYLSAISPGVSFTFKTADGTNAAGTETFQYQINTTQ